MYIGLRRLACTVSSSTAINALSDTFATMTRAGARSTALGDSFHLRDPAEEFKSGISARPSSVAVSSLRSMRLMTRDLRRSPLSMMSTTRKKQHNMNLHPDLQKERFRKSLEFQNLTYTIPHMNGPCRVCKMRARLCGGNPPELGVNFDESLVLLNDQTEDISVLRNISGQVMGGEIMAVMGPSGSG